MTHLTQRIVYWLYFLIISLILRGLLEISLIQIKEERKTLHDNLVKKVREKDRLQRRLKNMLLQHKMSKDALLHTQELYNKTKTQVNLHYYTYECFKCGDTIHEFFIFFKTTNISTKNKIFFCTRKESPTAINSVIYS